MRADRRTIRVYRAPDGEFPYIVWLRSIEDSKVRSRLRARLKLLQLGHLGDWKTVGGGVLELRMHFGSGWRVYVGLPDLRRAVLLWGGEKNTQSRDVARARCYGADFQVE